jgi:type IX secretion system PorP/SprF family membrane protein
MNFAYHLKTGKSSTISFGIRAGALNLQSDFQSLQNGASDPTAIDQAFSGNNLSAGFGFLFRNQFVEVGYSVPSIVQNTLNISDSITLDPINLTHLLFTQFEIPLDHNFKLHPGFLMKYFNGLTLNYDLNLLGSYKELIFLGASYRKSESVDLLMKLNITPQLQLAYAYDYPIGRLNNFSRGSNEILIRYIFRFQYDNIVSP